MEISVFYLCTTKADCAYPNLNYFHQLTVLTQTLITSTTTCYIILLFTTDNHQHLKATCFFNWMQFNFFKINVNSYHLYILAGGTLKGVNYHHKAKLRINESIRKDLYWMVSLSCLKFLWPWHEIILKRDIPWLKHPPLNTSHKAFQWLVKNTKRLYWYTFNEKEC